MASFGNGRGVRPFDPKEHDHWDGAGNEEEDDGDLYEVDAVDPYAYHSDSSDEYGDEELRVLKQRKCNHCNWQKYQHYFRHPYARCFVAVSIIFCNFLLYAEDPIAESLQESNISVIGYDIDLLFNHYPSTAGLRAGKVIAWMFFIALGMVLGKRFVHRLLLNRVFKLEMFSGSKGTWMIMFFTTLFSLYVGALSYNLWLDLLGESVYALDSKIGMTNQDFSRVAATGTFLGDFLTAFMVIDMMLQDKSEYSNWAEKERVWYNKHRISLFWVITLVTCSIVISFIAVDVLKWDSFGDGTFALSEMGRSFLAGAITAMDLIIVAQDWEFPTFNTNHSVNLPGTDMHSIDIKWFSFLRVHITGKWFNYGIITMVMMFDFKMLSNQVTYIPENYAQYYDTDGRIYTIVDSADIQVFETNVTARQFFTPALRVNSTDIKLQALFLEVSRTGLAFAVAPCICVAILFLCLLKFEDPDRYTAEQGGRRGVTFRSKEIEFDPETGKSKRRLASGIEIDIDNVPNEGNMPLSARVHGRRQSVEMPRLNLHNRSGTGALAQRVADRRQLQTDRAFPAARRMSRVSAQSLSARESMRPPSRQASSNSIQDEVQQRRAAVEADVRRQEAASAQRGRRKKPPTTVSVLFGCYDD
jgi:TMEM117 protein family